MVWLWLVVLAGCPKEQSSPQPSPEVPAEAPRAEWRLTPKMLDGYLQYQTALLVQEGKVKPPAFDGGLRTFDANAAEAAADFESFARSRAGLSEDDVKRIETIVAAVAARRMTRVFPRFDAYDEALAKDETIRPEQKAEMEKTRRALEAAKTDAEKLLAEREQFGNETINLLLSREKEVLGNWRLMMGLPAEAQ